MIKLNWTPEPAHVHRPEHPHARMAWTLWILAATALVAWIAGVATGISLGGRVHWLLPTFAGVLLASIVFGFRSVKHLEPMAVARDRIRHWRARRWSHRHPPGA